MLKLSVVKLVLILDFFVRLRNYVNIAKLLIYEIYYIKKFEKKTLEKLETFKF